MSQIQLKKMLMIIMIIRLLFDYYVYNKSYINEYVKKFQVLTLIFYLKN